MHVLMIADRDAKTALSVDLRSKVEALLVGKGNDVDVVEVGSDDVAPCLGCLLCLAKRHGECVNDDVMKGINQRIGDFDLLCYFGPIVFGQFSSTMKNVVDKAQTNRMTRSRFLIAIGHGDDIREGELATFLDIIRKHRGGANIVHPLFKERFEVFASRSLRENDQVCAQLRETL